MIFVNFKTYPNGTGQKAEELSKICAELSGSVQVLPVVQVVDLYRVKRAVGEKEVWTQHVDGVGYGQNTGWVLPEAIKEAGASGVLLNHSEHKLLPEADKLKTTLAMAGAVGLATLVFAGNLDDLKVVVGMKPSYVAYEPPELIGSKDHSVADQPEVVEEAAEIAKSAGVPFLVGAGIHSPQDIRASLVHGAIGVAVARDVLESVDPKQELTRLLEGFTHPGVELAGG